MKEIASIQATLNIGNTNKTLKNVQHMKCHLLMDLILLENLLIYLAYLLSYHNFDFCNHPEKVSIL